MKKQASILLLLFVCLFQACVEIDDFENTPMGNFEALWKIMDERYCFFEHKEVDWDDVYIQYKARITDDMTNDGLFALLDEMLGELKDGHVNLVSSFNVGRYWKWFEDYAPNYYQHVIDDYLGTDYYIAGGVRYKILEDNIGYMQCTSFSSSIGESNLDHIINRLSICNGIIIDIRENGGGLLTNSDRLASRFVNEKTLVGYIQHKTGKGHNDFSDPYARHIEPNGRLRYQKPVILLTNRSCYSAANDFVNAMRYCPNVIIVGDKTGGGSGLPFHSELPNGWSVRFSASPMLNAEKEHIESGIDPDIPLQMDMEEMYKGIDTYIEVARNLIKEKQ